MKLPIYQIDAFAEKPFEGNPAAVIPLREWLSDTIMQSIAEENNLAETAFFVPTESGFHIRWFTPTKEVKLCGHATLASAFVLFKYLKYESNVINFDSLSGPLAVTKTDDLLTLDFPCQKPKMCDIPEELVKGLGKSPLECYRNEDFVAVFKSQEEILGIVPNQNYLEKLDLRGIIVTAPSTEYDFVARFFAPKFGIPEDPVTGSAYTQLVPYWSNKMGKLKFSAKQLAPRGGKLLCELKGNRVLISGAAVKYLEGTIEI
jgi:PhzF family phenazine biosynthesis protein